jgi:hypothetical protein
LRHGCGAWKPRPHVREAAQRFRDLAKSLDRDDIPQGGGVRIRLREKEREREEDLGHGLGF